MRRMSSVLLVVVLVSICVLVWLSLTLAGMKRQNKNGERPDLKVRVEDLKHTVVTTHLEQEIPTETNVLWCITFQLAWNELNDLTGGTVQMESAPPIVSILNKQATSKNDLDEDSYVAAAGLASEGIYDKIYMELALKFGGKTNPELFDSSPHMEVVTYAFLFKELPFLYAFTRFHENLRFGEYYVDSFGIKQLLNSQEDEVKMARQVAILDFIDNEDFIIELKTRAKEDRLILAKVKPQKSLGDTVTMVEGRITKANPEEMRYDEDLFIPVLNFDIVKEYGELYGHPIRSSNEKVNGQKIMVAKQAVRFRLDETGAVLESETLLAASATQRNLVFDKPFLVFMKRGNAKAPYFALWVSNTELLVPKTKRKIKDRI